MSNGNSFAVADTPGVTLEAPIFRWVGPDTRHPAVR